MKKLLLIVMLSFFAFVNSANAYTRCECDKYFEGGDHFNTVWYQPDDIPNCTAYLWNTVEIYFGTAYYYDGDGFLGGWHDFTNSNELLLFCPGLPA